MVEWVRSLFGKGNKRKRGHIRINAKRMNAEPVQNFFEIFYSIKRDFNIFKNEFNDSNQVKHKSVPLDVI